MEISWLQNVLGAHRCVHNVRIAQINARRVFSPLLSDTYTMNSALLNAQEGMDEIS